MRRVEEQTGGRTRLGPGTLYSSIQKLLDAGFIAEVAARGEDGPGEARRRYYRLTGGGQRIEPALRNGKRS